MPMPELSNMDALPRDTRKEHILCVFARLLNQRCHFGGSKGPWGLVVVKLSPFVIARFVTKIATALVLMEGTKCWSIHLHLLRYD